MYLLIYSERISFFKVEKQMFHPKKQTRNQKQANRRIKSCFWWSLKDNFEIAAESEVHLSVHSRAYDVILINTWEQTFSHLTSKFKHWLQMWTWLLIFSLRSKQTWLWSASFNCFVLKIKKCCSAHLGLARKHTLGSISLSLSPTPEGIRRDHIILKNYTAHQNWAGHMMWGFVALFVCWSKSLLMCLLHWH